MLHRTLFPSPPPPSQHIWKYSSVRQQMAHWNMFLLHSHDLYPPVIRIMYTRHQCSARSLQVAIGYIACWKAFLKLSRYVSDTEKTVCIPDLVLNHLHSFQWKFFFTCENHDTVTPARHDVSSGMKWTPGASAARWPDGRLNCLSHTVRRFVPWNSCDWISVSQTMFAARCRENVDK
jgi:hypothetical protein